MEPTFVTHDLNYRRHDLWDQELATSILERGIVPGVSGESWSQYSSNCSMPLRSISWGSRTRAFYIAHKKQPESKIIQKELENGLVTTRFHDLMPKAVVEFLVSFHNTFHKGAGVSFLEVQADAPALEQEWRSFCKESGQTVRGIGAGRYEATMMAYIMKAGSDKLDNAEHYNNAKAGTRSNWKSDKQSVDPVHLRISIDVAYDVIISRHSDTERIIYDCIQRQELQGRLATQSGWHGTRSAGAAATFSVRTWTKALSFHNANTSP